MNNEDLNIIVGLIRNHAIGEWENFPNTMREQLARQIEEQDLLHL